MRAKTAAKIQCPCSSRHSQTHPQGAEGELGTDPEEVGCSIPKNRCVRRTLLPHPCGCSSGLSGFGTPGAAELVGPQPSLCQGTSPLQSGPTPLFPAGVYLGEKALQVSQPLHPDWMHTETAAYPIPTGCSLQIPQLTAVVKPWELFPPAFSSGTPFFRFLQIPASATCSE